MCYLFQLLHLYFFFKKKGRDKWVSLPNHQASEESVSLKRVIHSVKIDKSLWLVLPQIQQDV